MGIFIMVTFQSKIVDDFKELLTKEKIGSIISNDELGRICIVLENELIRKYNSIYNFINSAHNDGKESMSIVINLIDYKIMITILMCGSYRIKFIYRKSIKGGYDKSFLLNEFKREVGYVYIIKSKLGYKIGKTKNIKNRLKIFDVKLPFEFEIKHYIKTVNYNELEKHLHSYFIDKNINGEWFDLNLSDIEGLRLYLKSINYKLSDFDINHKF